MLSLIGIARRIKILTRIPDTGASGQVILSPLHDTIDISSRRRPGLFEIRKRIAIYIH